jgi:PKD repeat protein
MKKFFNNLFLLLFISIILFVVAGSCTEKAVPPAPAPFALFSMSKDGGVPPFEITFTNKSENTDTYVWDFGDNTPTSTEKSPKHTYTASGTYTVTLTATGKGGSTKAQQSVFIDKPISKIFLTSIIVEKIPFARVNGLRWDATSGPDLFITITSPLFTSKPNLYTQPNELWFRDIEFPSFLPVKIVLDSPLELVGLGNDFSVNVWDNDGLGVNEYMGNVTFKFSDYTTGANPYPTTIRKINDDYTVSLVVTWSK